MRRMIVIGLVMTAMNGFSQTLYFMNEGLGSFSSRIENYSLHTDNSAALTAITNFSISIHSKVLFMMKEMKSIGAAVHYPSKNGSIDLKINHNRLGSLNGEDIRFSYGRKLSEEIAVSANFGYEIMRAGNYKPISQLHYGLSFVIVATDDIHIGAVSFNPFTPKGFLFSSAMHQITMGIDFSSSFYAALNVLKSVGHPPEIRSFFNYDIVKKVSAKATISTSSESFWFAIQYHLKNYRCMISFSFHETLGMTPSITLSSKLAGKK